MKVRLITEALTAVSSIGIGWKITELILQHKENLYNLFDSLSLIVSGILILSLFYFDLFKSLRRKLP